MPELQNVHVINDAVDGTFVIMGWTDPNSPPGTQLRCWRIQADGTPSQWETPITAKLGIEGRAAFRGPDQYQIRVLLAGGQLSPLQIISVPAPKPALAQLTAEQHLEAACGQDVLAGDRVEITRVVGTVQVDGSIA